jgi:hypothetical protein
MIFLEDAIRFNRYPGVGIIRSRSFEPGQEAREGGRPFPPRSLIPITETASTIFSRIHIRNRIRSRRRCLDLDLVPCSFS